MRIFSISLIVLVSFVLVLGGCSKKQDAAIREKTNLGMGDMVKAKDLSIEGNVKESLASHPMCKYFGLSAVVSHDVITLTGTVRTEKQKQEA
ncbi:MAG: BON domain-containing protein, partial [bacterium]